MLELIRSELLSQRKLAGWALLYSLGISTLMASGAGARSWLPGSITMLFMVGFYGSLFLADRRAKAMQALAHRAWILHRPLAPKKITLCIFLAQMSVMLPLVALSIAAAIASNSERSAIQPGLHDLLYLFMTGALFAAAGWAATAMRALPRLRGSLLFLSLPLFLLIAVTGGAVNWTLPAFTAACAGVTAVMLGCALSDYRLPRSQTPHGPSIFFQAVLGCLVAFVMLILVLALLQRQFGEGFQQADKAAISANTLTPEAAVQLAQAGTPAAAHLFGRPRHAMDLQPRAHSVRGARELYDIQGRVSWRYHPGEQSFLGTDIATKRFVGWMGPAGRDDTARFAAEPRLLSQTEELPEAVMGGTYLRYQPAAQALIAVFTLPAGETWLMPPRAYGKAWLGASEHAVYLLAQLADTPWAPLRTVLRSPLPFPGEQLAYLAYRTSQAEQVVLAISQAWGQGGQVITTAHAFGFHADGQPSWQRQNQYSGELPYQDRMQWWAAPAMWNAWFVLAPDRNLLRSKQNPLPVEVETALGLPTRSMLDYLIAAALACAALAGSLLLLAGRQVPRLHVWLWAGASLLLGLPAMLALTLLRPYAAKEDQHA